MAVGVLDIYLPSAWTPGHGNPHPLATGLLSLLLRTDFFQVPAMEVSQTADGFPKPRDKMALVLVN